MDYKFIGRKKELEDLDKLLKGSIRYITIHGFGGIGKTALAVQAVRNFESERVLALSLFGVPTLSQVILKIARFLNISIAELEPGNLQDEILQQLQGDDTVLFYLDNMEDVKCAIDSGDVEKKKNAMELMKLFRQLPENVKILATSRIALGWSNEELVEVKGLIEYDGMQVFRQWICHRKNDVDENDGMKLSRLAYGHPLSLRLLGGVFNNCKEPINKFITNISERLRKATDPESVDWRHESVNICIQYSFEFLDIALQSFLGQLKSFEIPFTSTIMTRALNNDDTSAASSKNNDEADNLHKLWQHSWLNRHIYEVDQIIGEWRPKFVEMDKEFYSLHPTLRDFLNERFSNVDAASRAMSSDPEIQFYMAMCYAVGFGVVYDLEKRIEWFIEWCIKAATNGHLEAQVTLGMCYEQGGSGFNKSLEKSLHWYLKAAEADDKGAQQWVVNHYYRIADDAYENYRSFLYWWDHYQRNKTHSLEIQFDLSFSVLHRAVNCGKVEVVRLLAKQKALMKAKDKHGWTPLHWAVASGQLEIVKLLVEFGADTNVNAEYDEWRIEHLTPLHLAARGGHIEVVKFLVAELHVDVNAKTHSGWTPLYLAAENGHVEIVRLLVSEFGVDPNTKANCGKTAIQWAYEGGHNKVVKVLETEFGVDLKANFTADNELLLLLDVNVPDLNFITNIHATKCLCGSDQIVAQKAREEKRIVITTDIAIFNNEGVSTYGVLVLRGRLGHTTFNRLKRKQRNMTLRRLFQNPKNRRDIAW